MTPIAAGVSERRASPWRGSPHSPWPSGRPAFFESPVFCRPRLRDAGPEKPPLAVAALAAAGAAQAADFQPNAKGGLVPWVLPPVVALQHHLAPAARVSPCVGGEVNYMLFYGGSDKNGFKLKIDDGLKTKVTLNPLGRVRLSLLAPPRGLDPAQCGLPATP